MGPIEKATTSQKGVNMVSRNSHFEAKVVFKKTNRLHASSEFVNLYEKDLLLKFAGLAGKLSEILPVVINPQGKVLAGNARFLVAKILNLVKIPTVRSELLTKEELMKFSQAAMSTAHDLGLGINFLKVELQELKSIGLNMKFLIQNGDEEDGFTTV